jgi:Flp pilus assembly protein protease CpaA
MTKLDFFPDLAFGWTFYAVLVSFLAVASVVDFRSLRIPKALTISCLIAGVVFNLGRGTWLGLQDKAVWSLSSGPVLGALDGLLFSLAGFATAFAIFFCLWFLKVAGGGDVKLFAAVGAWVGPWYIVMLMVGSVFMVVLITLGMILTSMATSGFAQTHKSFSSQGSQRAIESGRRAKKRGPTFSFPLAFATAVIMLLVLSRDLGLAGLWNGSVPLPSFSQAR